MKNTPLTGIHYFKCGLQGLRRRDLRSFIIIPVAINIIIYGWFTTFAYSKIQQWNEQLLGFLPEWLSFLTWILMPMFIIMLLIIVAYSFTIMANLIASPFNGVLSEKVETNMLGKTVPSPSTAADWLMLVPKALGREFKKWMHFLPIIIVLLIATFIPVINLVSPILWFMFGCWSMAVQYCDFCADNNRQSFGTMKRGLQQYRWAYLGFGASVAVVSMIPLANLLVMPAAVIGGTLMWSENNRPNANQADPQGVILR